MDSKRHVLRSKIHRARVTDANPDYEGSVTIDTELMAAADILPFERVQVLSIDTGARLETYTMAGEPGSGTICINGAAARLIGSGELVIILTYAWVDEAEARAHKPRVVLVDDQNRPVAG